MSAQQRIIPTRVGTSDIFPYLDAKIEDHPHACGDKQPKGTNTYTGKGSSPRVWGQGGRAIPLSRDGRIIPTRVGTRDTENEIRLS